MTRTTSRKPELGSGPSRAVRPTTQIRYLLARAEGEAGVKLSGIEGLLDGVGDHGLLGEAHENHVVVEAECVDITPRQRSATASGVVVASGPRNHVCTWLQAHVRTGVPFATIDLRGNALARAGHKGTAIVGDGGHAIGETAKAGKGGVAVALQSGDAAVGEGGVAFVGEGGIARAGDDGTALGCDHAAAHAGDWGTVRTGYDGYAEGGDFALVQAGDYGVAHGGEDSTVVVGVGGTATAGINSTVVADRCGTATAGAGGIASVGERGIAQAGLGGVLVFGLSITTPNSEAVPRRCFAVDGIDVLADTPYWLTVDGQLAMAPEHSPGQKARAAMP